MLIRNVLPKARERLITILAEATIRDAARELARPDIDLLVVADEQGRLNGVITDSDIVAWVAEHGYVSADSSVVALMSTTVTTCTEDQSLTEVAEMAADRGLKHLPVVDPLGKAIGVIYVREALRELLHEAEITEQWLKAYLTGTASR